MYTVIPEMQSRILKTPVFSVEIIRNPFNLFDSRNTSDYYQCWKQFAALYFVEMVMHYIFQDLLINIKFNEQHLFAFVKYNTFVNAFITY